MITVNYFLDCRKLKADSPAPLKIAIGKDRERSYIPLSVKLYPAVWNAKDQTCSDRSLDTMLKHRVSVIRSFVFRLESEGKLKDLSAREIKDLVKDEFFKTSEDVAPVPSVPEGMFLQRFKNFRDSKKGRTYEIYDHTLGRIRAFTGEPKLRELKFEDINVRWLKDFDAFLSKTSNSANGRAIHMRNIRAVFNDALDDEIISCYPFRKFKIKKEDTPKRSLNIKDLRTLLTMPVRRHEELYRDMFKLIFMLIGINTVDLYNLKGITRDGRIEYKRAKTGRQYSIKVEPEAMELINKWKGKGGLLKIYDRWIDCAGFRKNLNKSLRGMGAKRSGLGGRKDEGMFPEITSYWARHSWATTASYLDIPKETIAVALGHGGKTVTDIYIDFDQRKVDDANRRVLDWVLYGKK